MNARDLGFPSAADYCNKKLSDSFREEGIIHETSWIYTHHENSLADRKIGCKVEKTRALLIVKLPKIFEARSPNW